MFQGGNPAVLLVGFDGRQNFYTQMLQRIPLLQRQLQSSLSAKPARLFLTRQKEDVKALLLHCGLVAQGLFYYC